MYLQIPEGSWAGGVKVVVRGPSVKQLRIREKKNLFALRYCRYLPTEVSGIITQPAGLTKKKTVVKNGTQFVVFLVFSPKKPKKYMGKGEKGRKSWRL